MFLRMDLPRLVYPLASPGTSESLPLVGMVTMPHRHPCPSSHMCAQFLGHKPSSGVTGLICNSMINFLKNFQTVPTRATPLHIPSRRVSAVPHHAHTCDVPFYSNRHSHGCEVVPQCALVCLPLVSSNVEHLFMCLLAICVSTLGNVYSIPLPVFNWVICLFIVEL